MAYNDIHSDIAVHTWTHPQMTTLSNLDVLAQLAWTIQIICDSTDGKIPRYWRPPYGDVDARASAIAKEVLGMTAILWNEDSEDWTMMETPPGTSLSRIQTKMETWLGGPKSPGLIILEHELSNSTIQGFVNMWPLIAQNDWTPVSQALLASNDLEGYDDVDGDLDDDSTDDSDVYQDGSDGDAALNSLLMTDVVSPTDGASSALASERSSSTGAPAGVQEKNGGMGLAHGICSLVLISGLAITALPLAL